MTLTYQVLHGLWEALHSYSIIEEYYRTCNAYSIIVIHRPNKCLKKGKQWFFYNLRNVEIAIAYEFY